MSNKFEKDGGIILLVIQLLHNKTLYLTDFPYWRIYKVH